MTTGKQLWPGETMRAFFRAHIRRETTLDAAAAERLTEALTRAVNRMLVWDLPAADVHAKANVAEAPQPSLPPPRPAAPQASAAASARGRRAAEEPFNPYAFSAMVVLAKNGRDGLMKRLGEIKSAEHLRSFAEAQHLALAPNIKKLDDLRRAIVAAAEQRLADRKAAAS